MFGEFKAFKEEHEYTSSYQAIFAFAQRGASATQILYADSKHGLPTPLNMQRFALDGTSTTNKSTESRIEEWIAYMQIHNNNPPKGHKIDVKQHDDSKPVGLGTFCFQGIFWLANITKVSVTSIENNDCKIKGWETSSADLWPQLLSGCGQLPRGCAEIQGR
jgi:hypothetical protein